MHRFICGAIPTCTGACRTCTPGPVRAGEQALAQVPALVQELALGTVGAALVAQTEVSLSLHRQLFLRRELMARIAVRFAEETVEGIADGIVAGTVEVLADRIAAGQSSIEAGTWMELRTVETRRTDWAHRTV